MSKIRQIIKEKTLQNGSENALQLISENDPNILKVRIQE